MRLPRHIENAIADFRGLRRPPPGAGREPAPMDSVMEVLVERFKIGKVRPEQALMEHWREVMGDHNAQRCSPERIDPSGRLLINVSNPILRREMMFSKRRILDRVHSIPGCEHIQDVDFLAG